MIPTRVISFSNLLYILGFFISTFCTSFKHWCFCFQPRRRVVAGKAVDPMGRSIQRSLKSQKMKDEIQREERRVIWILQSDSSLWYIVIETLDRLLKFQISGSEQWRVNDVTLTCQRLRLKCKCNQFQDAHLHSSILSSDERVSHWVSPNTSKP